MAVSERVKSIRESKGIKQCELADGVGVTQAMISQIEKGIRNPSLQVGYEIARVLECSIEDFFED